MILWSNISIGTRKYEQSGWSYLPKSIEVILDKAVVSSLLDCIDSRVSASAWALNPNGVPGQWSEELPGTQPWFWRIQVSKAIANKCQRLPVCRQSFGKLTSPLDNLMWVAAPPQNCAVHVNVHQDMWAKRGNVVTEMLHQHTCVSIEGAFLEKAAKDALVKGQEAPCNRMSSHWIAFALAAGVCL